MTTIPTSSINKLEFCLEKIIIITNKQTGKLYVKKDCDFAEEHRQQTNRLCLKKAEIYIILSVN